MQTASSAPGVATAAAGASAPRRTTADRQLACEACHRLRKRCDFLDPCGRCSRRGVECVYVNPRPRAPPLPPQSGPACQRCKASKRRCDREHPVCGRCKQQGLATCLYAMPPTPASSNGSGGGLLQGLESSPSSSFDSDSPESEAVSFNNSAVMQVFANSVAIEDPDLMPSIEDWKLLHSHFTQGTFSVLNYLIPKGFLETLFSQPPAIRLTWCAIASALNSPRLPKEVCERYFLRSQKAVTRCFNEITVESMQASTLISYFALVHNQAHVARPFQNNSLRLLGILKLELDPDDPIWAQDGIAFTETEKYSRRITFWVTFYSLRLMQSALPKVHPLRRIVVKSDRVKPAKKRTSRRGERQDDATVCYLVNILDLIDLIKTHHTLPPRNGIQGILDPAAFPALSSQLNSLKYKLPFHLLANNSTLPASDFLDSLTSDSAHTPRHLIVESLFDAIMISFTFNASLCLLYRPQLYLTHFLKIDSPFLLNNPAAITTLLTALDMCMRSARTATQLNSWLIHNPHWSRSLHHVYSGFALFEACIVIWFVCCRTRAFWFRNRESGASSQDGGALILDMETRRAMRCELVDALSMMRGNAESFSLVRPLIKCLEAMVAEMEAREAGMDTSVGMDGELETVLVGMKSMSLGPDGVMREQFGEAWGFLGLLGVEVSPGVAWHAVSEPEWKSFWLKEGLA
ncbi:hypothetical protein BC830DRAFT_1173182 [Chytriomyces sp. MP71]|nr:hypothetical protein BC830DRAFT_1173182 [Chytriomyces sp. MP71]